MILVRYIMKELFKNQLIILVILFWVFFCRKLIKVLSLLTNGNISAYLIMLYIGSSIPEIGKLIVPFSVFFSVLVTFYRFYIHNEITAMYVCAVSKYTLICGTIFFSGIVIIFAMINISWLAPCCSCYQNNLLLKIKENINLLTLTEKRFQLLTDKQIMVFIDKIHDNQLSDIFVVKKDQNKVRDNTLSIVISKQGSILNNFNGSQLISCLKGTYYEIHNKQNLNKNIWITEFSDYHMLAYDNQKIKMLKNNQLINCMTMCQLLQSKTAAAHVELHWRLTLLMSMIIMPMIAVTLIITTSYSYMMNCLLSIVLYIIFFLLHILLRSYVLLEQASSMMWIWIINIIYFLMVIILNWWNSEYHRRLYMKIFNFIVYYKNTKI